MGVTRRGFLKASAGVAAVSAFGGLGFSVAAAEEKTEIARFKGSKAGYTVCCYCAVGCGLIAHTADGGKGAVISIEGDPDHPVNEGALCPKGMSLSKLNSNKERPDKPLYRAPHSAEWKEVEWDWALKEIAKRVKDTRDATFARTNEKGETVNRTEAMVSFGSAALDNEECWTYQAFLRSIGMVNVEHQARI